MFYLIRIRIKTNSIAIGFNFGFEKSTFGSCPKLSELGQIMGFILEIKTYFNNFFIDCGLVVFMCLFRPLHDNWYLFEFETLSLNFDDVSSLEFA